MRSFSKNSCIDIARGSGVLKTCGGINQRLDVGRDYVPDFIVANSTDNILWCKETFRSWLLSYLFLFFFSDSCIDY